MMDTMDTYAKYLEVLREELIPAQGCTEPIAIAFAGALATKVLGCFPQHLTVACSGNMIKNAKSVVVPNSGGQKGIAVAATLGAVGGNSDLQLQVLTPVTPADAERARQLTAEDFCTVELLKSIVNLHILVTAVAGDDSAVVEIAEEHTNVVRVEKNGKVLEGGEYKPDVQAHDESRAFMSIAGIIDFAEHCNIEDVREILDKQILCNSTIATEGLSHQYSMGVGRSLLDSRGSDVRTRATAVAAAGSDARMGGSDLPVIINSGSGNQGITVSLPVIEYARELGLSDEKLYRALLISNLVAIHNKSGIGRLSAYCGAVSAACGSGAAITWMHGGSFQQIANTIVNTLVNVSGIVCDGAKSSCAAKISSAVDAAITAHHLSMQGKVFPAGEGIVKGDVEETIRSVSRLARDGMRETDIEVLHIMID